MQNCKVLPSKYFADIHLRNSSPNSSLKFVNDIRHQKVSSQIEPPCTQSLLLLFCCTFLAIGLPTSSAWQLAASYQWREVKGLTSMSYRILHTCSASCALQVPITFLIGGIKTDALDSRLLFRGHFDKDLANCKDSYRRELFGKCHCSCRSAAWHQIE